MRRVIVMHRNRKERPADRNQTAQLIDRFRAATGSASLGGILAAVDSAGGMWGLGMPNAPLARSAPQSSRWRLGGLFSGKTYATPERSLHETWREDLTRYHAWLGTEIFRFLAPLFPEFAVRPPLGLCCVSDKALAWSLALGFLEHDGPAALCVPQVRRSKKTPDPFSCLNGRYKLDSAALPGDLLTLHAGIERLLERLTDRLARFDGGTAAEAPPQNKDRAPGGLRRPLFWQTYAALSLRKKDRWAQEWLEAVNLLIDASPLTQWVYVDVLDSDRNVSGHPYGRNADAFGQTTWLSILACSIVGALNSPAPSWERLLSARQRLNAAQRSRRPRGDADRFVVSAQRECAQLESAIVAERVARLTRLQTLFHGNAYLHLTVLDMLAQHVLTSCGLDKMQRQWSEAQRAAAQDPLARRPIPQEVLFEGDGVCLAHFQRIVLGDMETGLTPRITEEIANLLRAIFQSPVSQPHDADSQDSAAQQLADASGVSPWAAEELLRRFFCIEMALPLRTTEIRPEPPRLALLRWLNALCRPALAAG